MKSIFVLALFSWSAGAFAAPFCGTIAAEGAKVFLISDEEATPPKKIEIYSMTEKTDSFLSGDVHNRAVCIDGKLINGEIHALKFLPPGHRR